MKQYDFPEQFSPKEGENLQKSLTDSLGSKPATELYSCSVHSDTQPDADP